MSRTFFSYCQKRLYNAILELTSSTAKTEQHCLSEVIIKSTILALTFEFVEENLKRKLQITGFFFLQRAVCYATHGCSNFLLSG